MNLFAHAPVLGWRAVAGLAFALATNLPAIPGIACAREVPPPVCHVESVDFEDWQARQLSNSWVKLVIVPQLGGRLMQVYFDGHPYLFVNPKYKGQYFPPAQAGNKPMWFNYGGDKIWPMPEGNEDEHHWPGPISDPLDDGTYAFTVLSTAPQCRIRLDGPPDPKTGLQYSREITLESDSPEIQFRAIMKNIADHPIQWSVQSVTQYDTKDPKHPGGYNRDFWAFTPANPNSAYLDHFHVRSGLADDPSFRVKDGLFSLHWLPLQNEIWLDSTAGWVAIVDGSSQYGMIEHFHYFPEGEYPGKATVIFYKNGSAIKMDEQGFPALSSSRLGEVPYYMEAELNSPILTLAPGQSYAMNTEWNPVRVGGEFTGVSEAGVSGVVFQATRTAKGIHQQGSFGVFFPGQLQAQLFDSYGANLASVPLQSVTVNASADLLQTIAAPDAAGEVSIHLIDANGKDRGELAKARIIPEGKSS